MPIHITTLIENSLGEHTGLKTEHGLSFLIETEETSVLFDLGRSGAFLDNADRLRKDLSQVTDVVLSHGHYDHTGGFRSFVEKRGSQGYTLWTGKGFFAEKYGAFNASYQFLGNDFDRDFIKQQGISLKNVSNKRTQIAPRIWVATDFARTHAQETPNPRFVKQEEGSSFFQADDFSDEVMLVIETTKGLVALVGCSHPGILNMIDSVEASFGQSVYALFGGTHLVEADEERTKCTMDNFAERGIVLLGISHCSGERAIALSLEHSSTNFRSCTGSTIILEG